MRSSEQSPSAVAAALAKKPSMENPSTKKSSLVKARPLGQAGTTSLLLLLGMSHYFLADFMRYWAARWRKGNEARNSTTLLANPIFYFEIDVC